MTAMVSVSEAEAWGRDLDELAERIAPRFRRTEARHRARCSHGGGGQEACSGIRTCPDFQGMFGKPSHIPSAHPFVRPKRPSLRPNLLCNRARRESAVKDGRRPPRSVLD